MQRAFICSVVGAFLFSCSANAGAFNHCEYRALVFGVISDKEINVEVVDSSKNVGNEFDIDGKVRCLELGAKRKIKISTKANVNVGDYVNLYFEYGEGYRHYETWDILE